MIEINLLPWRDADRLRRARKKKVLCWLGVALAMFMGFAIYVSLSSAQAPMQTPIRESVPLVEKCQGDLRQIRFVGYLRQHDLTWGLLLLPNGKTEDVQVGAEVGCRGVRVARIDAKNIVFRLPNRALYALPIVDT